MIADGKNRLIKVGINSDIVECWKQCYEDFKEQPKHIVKSLYGVSIDDACYSVFQYMASKVYYKLDDEGSQFIKSPARLLQDGCGDCKSLTMFVACCLHCLGITCIVRFVNFDGGTQYTHVYPVALDENGDEIIMDMCETAEGCPIFDYARPYKRKKDIIYG